MSVIRLKTQIAASLEKCFDLARSIDLHIQSMHSTQEKAVAGRTSGLINMNETVTWRAKHFKVAFKMTIKITEMEYPNHFTDEMVTGPFSKLHHHHQFKSLCNKTEMTDVFEFVSPFGLLGRFVNWLFLKRYMQKLLLERNRMIKMEAERQ